MAQVLAIVKDTKSLRNIEDSKSQAGPLEKQNQEVSIISICQYIYSIYTKWNKIMIRSYTVCTIILN